MRHSNFFLEWSKVLSKRIIPIIFGLITIGYGTSNTWKRNVFSSPHEYSLIWSVGSVCDYKTLLNDNIRYSVASTSPPLNHIIIIIWSSTTQWLDDRVFLLNATHLPVRSLWIAFATVLITNYQFNVCNMHLNCLPLRSIDSELLTGKWPPHGRRIYREGFLAEIHLPDPSPLRKNSADLKCRPLKCTTATNTMAAARTRRLSSTTWTWR